MTISQFSNNSGERSNPRRVFRLQVATLIMLSTIALAGIIVFAWFAGEGTITQIFAQINTFQQSPPFWLEVPMVTGHYLLAPTILLLLIVLAVMKISAEPQPWSRFLVVTILIVLTIRYILWRSLSTLNLYSPVSGVFSLGLFCLEMLTLSSSTIQLFLMLRVKDRRREADQLSTAVLNGSFTPTVDILIPTYNEPTFILRRTIIGCQALNYVKKKVYLLDDTARPEVKALATELGCHYITRPHNYHAKAGNLNHAIAKTQGELIVVFDADFIPTQNFLTRTVGFFQDEQVALVQTPQSFYNADPIARNLGLENVLTPEEEVFYRQVQPIRDAAGSVICSGTSFVVRRSALETTGGFVTDSLSEDYFTGVRISAQGYRLVYLDEKLSAGLAAENIAAYATQRLRWARGTLQAFFIDANPLTIRGLKPLQRLAHLEGLLHWFTSISRVGFLLFPLAYSFLGVIPIRATLEELLYFFLPYYMVQLSAFAWLNYRSRSALLSDIYSLVLCWPLAFTVVQVMLNPFSKGFRVTPKGTASDRYSFNWSLAWPLLVLFILTAVSLWRNLGLCFMQSHWGIAWPPDITDSAKGLELGWIWSTYNLIMIGIALLILLDVPRPTVHEWFDLRRTVRLSLRSPRSARKISPIPSFAIAQVTPPANHPPELLEPMAHLSWLSSYSLNLEPFELWGVTTMLSEVGARVALTQAGFPALKRGETLPVALEILEEGLKLQGVAICQGFSEEFPVVQVMFERVSLPQHRRLVEILFCRPGQWKRRETPGELRSLVLLFQILLRPQVLFGRKSDISAVSVAKV